MKFSKVRNVKSPCRGTGKSAGVDFFIPEDYTPAEIRPGESALIPSGIRACIPEGYMLMGADKSGIALKHLIVGAKIIDEDYQGEIHIHVINIGRTPAVLRPGQKIAQFILVPVLYGSVEEVNDNELFTEASERGAGGFGSTGTE